MELKALSLNEINDKLITLPAEIAREEEKFLLLVVEEEEQYNGILLASEQSSADKRKAEAEMSVSEMRKELAKQKARYHGMLNQFEAVCELARNKRSEMKVVSQPDIKENE